MEMKSADWSEKRINPRISAVGEVAFRAYWLTDFCGGTRFLCADLHADLIDTSVEGMRIKTSFPLTKRAVLERINNFADSVKEIALVKWVEKMDNCYYAGLLFTLKLINQKHLQDDPIKPGRFG